MLSEEKFYDRAAKFALLKDVDGKYYTFEEYKALTEANQTDKEGNLIYLYTTNANDQQLYPGCKRQSLQRVHHGWSAGCPRVTDGNRSSKIRSSVWIGRYDRQSRIRKDNVNKVTLNEDEKNALQEMFKSQLPNTPSGKPIRGISSLTACC